MSEKNAGAKGAAAGDSPSELIDARIRELDDWRGETLARIRALIKQADPEVVEDWKWRGVPVWSHGGIICTGETYKSVVKMTFPKGASLEDPAGLFNSSLEGNTRRAIDVREGEKLDEKAFKALVRAAVARTQLASARPRAALRSRPAPARRGTRRRAAPGQPPRCVCRAAAAPAEAIRSRSRGERASSSSASLMACGSGGHSSPLTRCSISERGPPASTASTGTPLAWASSTTCPKVSVALGNTNMSALAYAAGSCSPSSQPRNVAQSPRRSARCSRSGPSPASSRRSPGRRSRASRKASASRSTPFSCVIRPA